MPKRPAPNRFANLLPSQLEQAYAEVEQFLTLRARDTGGLAKEAHNLLTRLGEPVRKPLVEILCNETSILREVAESALSTGAKSAVGLLVPLLVAQFALAPAIALVVATFVVKVLATHGRTNLCAELSKVETKPRLRRAPPSRKKTPAPKRKAPPKKK